MSINKKRYDKAYIYWVARNYWKDLDGSSGKARAKEEMDIKWKSFRRLFSKTWQAKEWYYNWISFPSFYEHF